MIVLGLSIIIVLVGIIVSIILNYKRANVPSHLSNHNVHVIPDLIPKDIGNELIELMKEFGNFPSNVDQSRAQGFKPLHEDIGEAQPINSDGSCDHNFLFPNGDKVKCILPQRVVYYSSLLYLSTL